MIRMSTIRNYPVVCAGRQIGVMQNIRLKPNQKAVEALIISCGIRGKRIVRVSEILSIANGFILIKKDENYFQQIEKNNCQFVRDTTGLLSGRITDYAINKSDLSIYAIEIILGYTLSERKKRIWLYEYQKSSKDEYELIIPTALGIEQIISEEESGLCECQQ